MSDNDFSDNSSDEGMNQDDYKIEDANEQEEDPYFDENRKPQVAMLTESTMITNTDLYAFAEEFMKLIENRTLLWPVPMLKIIKFLSDKSIEYSKHEYLNDGNDMENFQQLFNEVNLVMIMLLLNVPIQLDIEVGNRLIDFNDVRRISYKKQPFHEPLIILKILYKAKVVEQKEIRKEVFQLILE